MDADGKELTSPDLWALFRQTYLVDDAPMTLVKQQTVPTSPDNRGLRRDAAQGGRRGRDD